MDTDPRIDEYIERAGRFAQPILRHVRTLWQAALPGGEEGIKWGAPHLMMGGKNAVGMAAFKAHCAVMLHGEAQSTAGMGNLGKIAALADLPPDDELIQRMQQSAANAQSGEKPRRKPRPELPIPDDLAAAFDTNPAAQGTFAGFAPSYRREYLEWIVGAKREATRKRRIDQAIGWLAEGKKRNWKYENC